MCVYGNRNLGCELKISPISDWVVCVEFQKILEALMMSYESGHSNLLYGGLFFM
jgi:hypothetical protein